MFLVSDTMEKRHSRIREFLGSEDAIAVLLAAADFEWTVRRSILALGKSPTKKIREDVLNKCSGLERYKEAWKKEVTPRLKKGLPDVVGNWEFLIKDAIQMRNRFIHGEHTVLTSDYSQKRIVAILEASKKLVDFAEKNNEPLYGRKIVRIKPR